MLCNAIVTIMMQPTNRPDTPHITLASDQPPQSARDVHRELEELLSEIRVVLPGTTVLFAFLLTLPFTETFKAVSVQDRVAFFVAFMTTALAMVFLMALSGYHQLRGKPYDKSVMLRTTRRQVIAALVLLSVSLTAVVFLVTDMVFSGGYAIAVSGAVFAFAATIWFGVPLVRRVRGDH